MRGKKQSLGLPRGRLAGHVSARIKGVRGRGRAGPETGLNAHRQADHRAALEAHRTGTDARRGVTGGTAVYTTTTTSSSPAPTVSLVLGRPVRLDVSPVVVSLDVSAVQVHVRLLLVVHTASRRQTGRQLTADAAPC